MIMFFNQTTHEPSEIDIGAEGFLALKALSLHQIPGIEVAGETESATSN
jgi:hypothetical protein